MSLISLVSIMAAVKQYYPLLLISLSPTWHSREPKLPMLNQFQRSIFGSLPCATTLMARSVRAWLPDITLRVLDHVELSFGVNTEYTMCIG